MTWDALEWPSVRNWNCTPHRSIFCPGFGGPDEDEKRFVQLLWEEMEKVGARVHVPRLMLVTTVDIAERV